MLLRMVLVRTDVSEELFSSIIRVTRIGELGTTLAVTSNLRTLLRNTMYFVPPKCRFLQEPHGVTSQKTALLIKIIIWCKISLMPHHFYSMLFPFFHTLYQLLKWTPYRCVDTLAISSTKNSRTEVLLSHWVQVPLHTHKLFRLDIYKYNVTYSIISSNWLGKRTRYCTLLRQQRCKVIEDSCQSI
jgi:hypothetical protein